MESKSKVYNVSGITNDELIGKVQTALMTAFSNPRFKFVENNMTVRTFKVRVQSKLLNPIVSLKGLMRVKCDTNQCAVKLEYDTKTNFWFWFTFLIGCFFPILWILMIWMWSSQKRRTIEALTSVLDSLDYDLTAG